MMAIAGVLALAMEARVTPSEALDAKISNERLKLLAGLLNALAASAVVGSLVALIVAGTAVNPFWSTLVAGLGALLHLLGLMVLDFLKPEH